MKKFSAGCEMKIQMRLVKECYNIICPFQKCLSNDILRTATKSYNTRVA